MTESEEIAVLKERLKGMEKALELQAKEYERRLYELNHAHEEARRVLGTYLPRETWEAWIKDEGLRREKLDHEIANLRTEAQSAKTATVAVAANTSKNIAVGLVIIGIVSIMANILTSGGIH